MMSNVCAKCGRAITNTKPWHDNGEFHCDTCAMDNIARAYAKAVGEELKKPNPYYQRVKQIRDAKADSGKPNLSLVPTQIILEIEKIRAYGTAKYGDSENWKKVELERYHQALLRHTLAIWNDINAKDEESGLLHLSHIACNVAFILELMKDGEADV